MAQASRRQSARITERDPRYLFTVAQIFNLPYRRFVIGRTLLAGGKWQVKNLRYSAARRGRNQFVPTTDEHGWTRIRESLSSSVLIRVHPWLKKSSRAATISGDTDRLRRSGTAEGRIRPLGKCMSRDLATLNDPTGSFNVAKAKTGSSVFQGVSAPGAFAQFLSPLSMQSRRNGL